MCTSLIFVFLGKHEEQTHQMGVKQTKFSTLIDPTSRSGGILQMSDTERL